MFLKKLVLKDFRQFKGTQEILFSQDVNQNVTIIIGENGTGKTTFSQAFIWCLYGETVFTDKSLICKATAQEINPSDECIVSVWLEFNHNDIEYKCKREQIYFKDLAGSIKSKANSKFILEYKGDDGQQKYVAENILESEVNKILPRQLSHYFFFDGERISVMSKEIAAGKSKEFSEAVRNLLGLSALENALHHLNGQHNLNSVIRSYNKSFDTSGNADFEKLKTEIGKLEEHREKINKQLSDIENKDLITASEQIEKLKKEQKELAFEKNDFERRDSLYKDLDKIKNNRRKMHIDSLLKSFSETSYSFFAQKLIKEAMKKLEENDIKDKGIPDIHERTIKYLFDHHECICGTPIEEGSVIHKHLLDLLQYIPPQSLGTSVREFTSVANEKLKSENFYENFETEYTMLHNCDDEIAEIETQISDLNKKLENSSEEKIAQKQKELKNWEKKRDELLEKKGKCGQEISDLTNEINGKTQVLSKYSNLSANNKKISLYIKYAHYVYNALKSDYDVEETKVRTQFEKTVNQIFKKIYDGGFSLEIDEKYNIKIIVNGFNGYNENVETSTAQSLSIILSFISAVIKMARENQYEGDKMRVTESYPLVMDAPLSAFDKTRIRTICEVLPNIAEQVIIFINDKDGEIAEANMKEKIGKKYKFMKKNEFETYMEEV